MKRLIIFGCGGHARSVVDVFLRKHSGWDLVFVDENALENERGSGKCLSPAPYFIDQEKSPATSQSRSSYVLFDIEPLVEQFP